MMLNEADNPIAWGVLMYELDDAKEHLGSLIQQMLDRGTIEEEDYAVQLGHIFAHLNRAWHGRTDERLDSITQEDHRQRSEFPADLVPVG